MFIHTDDGPDLVGVAVFAIPAQAKVLANVFPELRPYVESLELARFVLERRPVPATSEGTGTRTACTRQLHQETWFLAGCHLSGIHEKPHRGGCRATVTTEE